MISRPHVQCHILDSQCLKGNAFGDATERELTVYLPPGYDPQRCEPYPVMVLLTGWSGRGAYYLNEGLSFTRPLHYQWDQAIAAGTLPPFIAVLPDCTFKLGCSQYINSVSTGPYMDYLCDEIVPWVDAHFHTHRQRDFRAVLGHSSGGFGALVVAMMRPEVFAGACSSAGDSWYDYLYLSMIAKAQKVLSQAGGIEAFVATFLKSPNPGGLLSREQGETMMLLNMCACFTPNLQAPVIKGDVFFDLHTGAIMADVWQRFRAWDPLVMVEQDAYAQALAQLRWLQLDAGGDDEYGLHLGHRQLSKKLNDKAIVHQHNEYPGKHGGHSYRFVERIGQMLKAFV